MRVTEKPRNGGIILAVQELWGPALKKVLALLAAAIIFSSLSMADQTVAGANADPIYKQLRDISLGGEIIAVKDFTLRRDAGAFKFRQGTFVFLTPVNGKVTGAI